MIAAISYDPIISIHLGPLSISPHGIFTALGVLAGAVLLMRQVRTAGLDEEAITAVLTRSIVAALLGARLAYVLNHLSHFDSPLEVLRVWEGGASLLGGITAALLVAVVELRRRRIPVLGLLDLAAPWFTLGIAIGRVGDL
ncbi:MAG: prolipoprotein diacylglyceryl transferase, partial [Acidimicrobiia bacterium]|nr:prolipoprotein diacylglyceryl transferase [Acidimicrobiia bacterium]